MKLSVDADTRWPNSATGKLQQIGKKYVSITEDAVAEAWSGDLLR
jgi:hypothetical protein